MDVLWVIIEVTTLIIAIYISFDSIGHYYVDKRISDRLETRGKVWMILAIFVICFWTVVLKIVLWLLGIEL